MADWRLKMEAQMVEIASREDRKMERVQEIHSWFVSKIKLSRAAMDICEDSTMEQNERLTPDGMPKWLLEIML